MTEHSPEPWEEGEMTCLGGGSNCSMGPLGADGKRIIVPCASRGNQCDGNWIRDADRERIIACVNACKGYGTAQLEFFGESQPKDPDSRFLELVRDGYRAMYSQQKHLDSDNDSQIAYSKNALSHIEAAFRLVGATL